MPKLLYLTTQDKFFLSHVKGRTVFAKEHGYDIVGAVQKTNDSCAEIRNLGIAFVDTEIERQSINPFSQIKDIYQLIDLYKREKSDIVHHLEAKSIISGRYILIFSLMHFWKFSLDKSSIITVLDN